ncbi:DNRLRE domain-containing protein, partial [Rhizomonospora bruguierae]|uniref:DNRLRE domain-containing protein n=1 Tax=Rhizomonospora bruguierae TaxID=1581705 RepID=UPI0020BFA61F
MTSVLAGSVLAVPVLAGRVDGQDAPPPSASDSLSLAADAMLEAPDQASAMLLAYRKRRSVEVTGLRTPTAQVWAQPDGTLQSRVHVSPVRMLDAANRWVDIDLTLERRADGSVVPKAHPRGLTLSGGHDAGSDDLVVLGGGADRVRLGWRGQLPAPVLDGATATYVDVRPGVDLVVEARRTGFEYSFRIKTLQAVGELRSVSMPWQSAATLTGGRAGASLTGQAPSGSVVSVSPAVMWDASPMTAHSGERPRTAEVPMSLVATDSGTDLVLSPGEEFFADPAVTFPVTVDPSVNLEPGFDTFVQDTISNTDQSGSTELKLGYSDDATKGCGGGCKARSFLTFKSLNAYWDSTVTKAELFLWETVSWSCTGASWEAWRTGAASTSTRWGAQPAWSAKDGTSTATKGYSGCAAGWVSVSVKNILQYSFTNHQATANIGLRASSETNHDGWKKFNSSEASSKTPYIELTYNRTPNVPNAQKISPCFSAC